MATQHRIALWSGPRNVSTALMYSFAQRTDTRVVDEPLFGYFLKHTGAERPSREEVLATMPTDPEVIIKSLQANHGKEVLFMKHIANHLVGLDWQVLSNFSNVILTRDPTQMLPSYAVHVNQPTLLDTAYEIQVQLLRYLLTNGIAPVVVDAKQILLHPSNTLSKLCQRLNIPFQNEMLQWEKGPLKEDGIWAKYWYHGVHQSTGFAPYREKTTPFPDHLKPLLEQCQPLYEELLNHAL